MTFKERMDKFIEKGVQTSTDVFEKAKKKTKKLKEKASLKMDIRHHEREAGKKLASLGSAVYDLLITKGQASISKGTADIKSILTDIQDIEKKLEEAEEELKKFV